MELGNRRCVFNETRVVVVHTVNICPNLNLSCTNCCSNEGSSIVGATALQVIYLTVCISANKTLSDIDFLTWIFLQLNFDFLTDILEVWFSILIGAHKLKCWNQSGIHAQFLQVVCYHIRRENFALSDDDFLLKHGEDTFCERTQVVEFLLDEIESLFFPFLCGIEFIDVTTVFLLERIDGFICSLWILLVEVVCNFDEGIGCSRHSRENNNFLLSIVNEFHYIFHSLWCTYGCTTKFQYFHYVISF